jgi:hypothetical protein
MAYPKKAKRNKELVKKRQQGWSYRKLADYYNINVKTAFEIYQNEVVGTYPQKVLDSVGR